MKQIMIKLRQDLLKKSAAAFGAFTLVSSSINAAVLVVDDFSSTSGLNTAGTGSLTVAQDGLLFTFNFTAGGTATLLRQDGQHLFGSAP